MMLLTAFGIIASLMTFLSAVWYWLRPLGKTTVLCYEYPDFNFAASTALVLTVKARRKTTLAGIDVTGRPDPIPGLRIDARPLPNRNAPIKLDAGEHVAIVIAIQRINPDATYYDRAIVHSDLRITVVANQRRKHHAIAARIGTLPLSDEQYNILAQPGH